MTSKEKIEITIGRAEALILFEMLAEFYHQPDIRIRDAVERLSFVRLHRALESTLVEPFTDSYHSLVEEARVMLIQQAGAADSS